MLRRDGDYFGAAVNVASRVADLAEPGEVRVTRAVVEAWTGGDGVGFDRVGDFELKNVATPVSLYRASLVDRPLMPAAASSRRAGIGF